MKIKHSVLAKYSTKGYYGFQYPDLETKGFLLHSGETLEKLPWAKFQEYEAFLWNSSKKVVVWIKDSDFSNN